jgi:hypothetical protein
MVETAILYTDSWRLGVCLNFLRIQDDLSKTLIVYIFRAEIIKIEHPIRGDDTRAWGPPFAAYTDGRTGNGESAYYLSVSLAKIDWPLH